MIIRAHKENLKLLRWKIPSYGNFYIVFVKSSLSKKSFRHWKSCCLVNLMCGEERIPVVEFTEEKFDNKGDNCCVTFFEFVSSALSLVTKVDISRVLLEISSSNTSNVTLSALSPGFTRVRLAPCVADVLLFLLWFKCGVEVFLLLGSATSRLYLEFVSATLPLCLLSVLFKAELSFAYERVSTSSFSSTNLKKGSLEENYFIRLERDNTQRENWEQERIIITST